MNSQVHEFEDKKFSGEKCAVCATALKGMFGKKGHQCRNCLKIVCQKCRKKPDANQGCGPPEGFGGASAAPAAKDPVMEFYVNYVKRNAEGKMVVRGLPDEWKQLFKEAGVKPSELKDPQTAIWLINLMNDILAGKVQDSPSGGGGGGGSGALKVEALYDFAAVQEGDLSFSKGSIIVVVEQYDNGWAKGQCNNQEGLFPFNYVKELPPEPSHAPPPPPPGNSQPSTPAPQAPQSNFPPPVIGGPPSQPPPQDAAPAPIVAAPMPPPPAPTAKGPPPPGPPPPSGPKPGAPPPPAGPKPGAGGGGGGRGGLLDQIAQGKQLRHVDEQEREKQSKKELSELTGEERTNMLDIISNAMNARRAAVDDDEDEDDDDEWSD